VLGDAAELGLGLAGGPAQHREGAVRVEVVALHEDPESLAHDRARLDREGLLHLAFLEDLQQAPHRHLPVDLLARSCEQLAKLRVLHITRV
jgi:hypothetical protein